MLMRLPLSFCDLTIIPLYCLFHRARYFHAAGGCRGKSLQSDDERENRKSKTFALPYDGVHFFSFSNGLFKGLRLDFSSVNIFSRLLVA